MPLAFADLSGQDFRGKKLYKADLRGTNFTNANMEGASLFGAFAKDAKFTGAKLGNADLESVDFENADLSDAVLEGAQVSWRCVGMPVQHPAARVARCDAAACACAARCMCLASMYHYAQAGVMLLCPCRSPTRSSKTSLLQAATVRPPIVHSLWSPCVVARPGQAVQIQDENGLNVWLSAMQGQMSVHDGVCDV